MVSTDTATCPRTDTAILKIKTWIGYEFKNPSLLMKALTHPSSTVEEFNDNERLEFLGDAVVNLCVGEAVFAEYPQWNEGRLTQIKSAVVSTVSLAKAAERMGMRELGRLGKGLPHDEPLPCSVYANLFEAVSAAVFLDGGIEAARRFILRHLKPIIAEVIENGHEFNHKSALQQVSQRLWSVTPSYRLVSSTGPDHGKIFEIVAMIGERAYPPGFGRSKKEAEQVAAKNALELIQKEHPEEAPYIENGNGRKPSTRIKRRTTSTAILNEK
jgi:ribonuclease-3